MTAVTTNFVRIWRNLPQQVQTQISLKPKTFLDFLIALMKFTLKFRVFEKKDQSHSLSINEINNCKTSSYISV